MKTITKQELQEKLELHKLYLEGDPEGELLFLIGYDLSELDLSESNLSESTLIGCNFSKSDLSESDLSKSDLRGSNLSECNLSKCDLEGTVGNLRQVKNLSITSEYNITYTHTHLQIGCANHSIEDWRTITLERVLWRGGKKAAELWEQHKEWLLNTIDTFPAEAP
jgi:uncharacterized protein YjbI with pentapeptide repeats